jgi:hypothetical protein
MTDLSTDLKVIGIDLDLRGLLEDLIKLFQQKDNKRELGEKLARISLLLKQSADEIGNGRLPRKQSAEIAALLLTFRVAKTQRLLDTMPNLRDAVDDFENLGFRMREADYFIDHKAHSSITNRSTYYPRSDEQNITEEDVKGTLAALERFVGMLDGLAFSLGYRPG